MYLSLSPALFRGFRERALENADQCRCVVMMQAGLDLLALDLEQEMLFIQCLADDSHSLSGPPIGDNTWLKINSHVQIPEL